MTINSSACTLSSSTDRQRFFFGSLCILSGRKTRARVFFQGLLLAFVMLANAWAVDYPEGYFGCEYKVNNVWRAQPFIGGLKAEAWRSPNQNQSVTSMRFGRTVRRTVGNCGTYTVTVGVKAGIGYLKVRGQEVVIVTNPRDSIEYKSFTFVMYQNETVAIDLIVNLGTTPYAGGSLTWSDNFNSMNSPNEVTSPPDLWSAEPTDYTTTSWHQKTWTPTPTYLAATTVGSPSLWRELNINGNVGLALWKKKFVASEPGYYQFTLRVKNGWAILRCNDWDVMSLDSQGYQFADTKTIVWNSAPLQPGNFLNMAYAIGFHGNSFWAGGDLQVDWVRTPTPPAVNDSEPLAADFWNSSNSDYITTHWHEKTWSPAPVMFLRSQWLAADVASLWRDPYSNANVGSVMMRRKFVALDYGRYVFTMRIKNGWAVLRCNGVYQMAEPDDGSRPEDIQKHRWTSSILRKNDELNIDFATRFFGGDYNKFWAGGDLAVKWEKLVNNPPTGTAGANRIVTVGEPFTISDASFTDPESDPLTFYWRASHGWWDNVKFPDRGQRNPQVTITQPGDYVLAVGVNDGYNPEVQKFVNVSAVQPKVNKAPVVNAGPDIKITFYEPAIATLKATVTDDGLPGPTIGKWTTVSGPFKEFLTLDNEIALSPTVKFFVPGTYVFRYTASDGALSASDDVQVTVAPTPVVNEAPVVNAGPDVTLTLPAPATLKATVTDDGLPGPTTTGSWSQVSPNSPTATFDNKSSLSPKVTFSAPGAYVFRYTANDSALATSDDVQVTVAPAPAVNKAPVVNAVPNQSVTLERLPNGTTSKTINLQGSATDDNLPLGRTLLCYWNVLSRPTGAPKETFSAWTNSTCNVTFTVPGTYNMRLVVSDGALWSSRDFQVTVAPAPAVNKAPVVNVGSNQSVTLERLPNGTTTKTITLQGSATDDNLPLGRTLTYTWKLITWTPPRTYDDRTVPFTFSASTAPTTHVTFTQAGTYLFRLVVSDGALSPFRDVKVTVAEAEAEVLLAVADDLASDPSAPSDYKVSEAYLTKTWTPSGAFIGSSYGDAILNKTSTVNSNVGKVEWKKGLLAPAAGSYSFAENVYRGVLNMYINGRPIKLPYNLSVIAGELVQIECVATLDAGGDASVGLLSMWQENREQDMESERKRTSYRAEVAWDMGKVFDGYSFDISPSIKVTIGQCNAQVKLFGLYTPSTKTYNLGSTAGAKCKFEVLWRYHDNFGWRYFTDPSSGTQFRYRFVWGVLGEANPDLFGAINFTADFPDNRSQRAYRKTTFAGLFNVDVGLSVIAPSLTLQKYSNTGPRGALSWIDLPLSVHSGFTDLASFEVSAYGKVTYSGEFSWSTGSVDSFQVPMGYSHKMIRKGSIVGKVGVKLKINVPGYKPFEVKYEKRYTEKDSGTIDSGVQTSKFTDQMDQALDKTPVIFP